MKIFLGIIIAIVFATVGAFAGLYYADSVYANKFKDMTGLTVGEFDAAYAGCVVRYGELCNLYGGFAPLSKFNDGRDGNAVKPPADML